MKRLAVVGLFLATILLAVVMRTRLAAETKPAPRRISVDEIGTSVVLVGRLGAPLGEKMEITGRWHFPPTPDMKDDSIRFTVVSVNGRRLDTPVEFNHEQLDFGNAEHRNVIPEFSAHKTLDGQTWTLTAYETGRIQMVPNEYRSPSPVFPIAGRPYYTKPFTSELVGVLTKKEALAKP